VNREAGLPLSPNGGHINCPVETLGLGYEEQRRADPDLLATGLIGTAAEIRSQQQSRRPLTGLRI
jgi:hypothetical protein